MLTGDKLVEFLRAERQEERECDDHKCSVCYCNYEKNDVLRTLPCGHHYHAECIDGWLADNPTCPMCKVSIKPEGGQLEGGSAAADAAAFNYE